LDLREAPLGKQFRNDISLVVNESLIRAIEIRTTISRSAEKERAASVQRSVEEGFIFTHYFYEALAGFEKESAGMNAAYGNLLHDIDLEHERKRAHDTTFAAQASPEVISPAKVYSAGNLLNTAEQKLAQGDVAGARDLAQQVLEHNNGGDEPGRAAFILARAATLSGDMQAASAGFQQAVQSLHDARLLAWSHIYLGRIFDIQEQREAAVAEYRAALAAGDPAADTKSAAEKGLAAPYQPKPRAPR
jgi:tetratricopeptide (TPR) repeat protein